MGNSIANPVSCCSSEGGATTPACGTDHPVTAGPILEWGQHEAAARVPPRGLHAGIGSLGGRREARQNDGRVVQSVGTCDDGHSLPSSGGGNCLLELERLADFSPRFGADEATVTPELGRAMPELSLSDMRTIADQYNMSTVRSELASTPDPMTPLQPLPNLDEMHRVTELANSQSFKRNHAATQEADSATLIQSFWRAWRVRTRSVQVTRHEDGFGLKLMESTPCLDDAVVVDGSSVPGLRVGSRIVAVGGRAVISVSDISSLLTDVVIGGSIRIAFVQERPHELGGGIMRAVSKSVMHHD